MNFDLNNELQKAADEYILAKENFDRVIGKLDYIKQLIKEAQENELCGQATDLSNLNNPSSEG